MRKSTSKPSRPVVQQAHDEDNVELVFPERDLTIELDERVCVQMFSDVMRIITEMDPEFQPGTESIYAVATNSTDECPMCTPPIHPLNVDRDVCVRCGEAMEQ